MPYGPNRWGVHPKSTAIKAGGITMFYRHPYLVGQVASNTNIDEIDVSRACKLGTTFFDANPTIDSAYQEVLVDGSVIHITNTLLAGEMSLQVLEQGGFVGSGDFIAALHLVISKGDSIGGLFTTIRNFNGIPRVRTYFGVFAKNVPHERVAGNAVIEYNVRLSYSGWYDGIGKADTVKDYIWAVGNRAGLSGFYSMFKENQAEAESIKGNQIVDGDGNLPKYPLHADLSQGYSDEYNQIPDWPNNADQATVEAQIATYPNISDAEVKKPVVP